MAWVASSRVMTAITAVDDVSLSSRAKSLNGKVFSLFHLCSEIGHGNNGHALFPVDGVPLDAVSVEISDALHYRASRREKSQQ